MKLNHYLVFAKHCSGVDCSWKFDTLPEAVRVIEELERKRVLNGKLREYSTITMVQVEDLEDPYK